MRLGTEHERRGTSRQTSYVLLIATIMMVACAICIMSSDDGFSEGELRFTKDCLEYDIISDSDMTVKVIGYELNPELPDTEITIPSSITFGGKEYSVVSIGKEALRGIELIEGIRIEYGISTIEERAFQQCPHLRSVDIPGSVKTIGDYAFSGCTKLTTVNFNGSGLESIGQYGFSQCGLQSILVPDTTSIIGDYAFSGCENLKTVRIEGAISTLPSHVFKTCPNIKELVLPISFKASGEVFRDFKNLQIVTLTKGNGMGANYTEEEGKQTPWYLSRESLSGIRISSGIGYIGEYTFYGSTISTFTLTADVKAIGKCAFMNATKLTTLTFNDGLEVINDDVFKGCGSINKISLPSSMLSVGTHAFQDCSSATELTLSATRMMLGKLAFSGITSLKKLVFPGGAPVTTPEGLQVFSGCNSIETIEFTWAKDQLDYSDVHEYTPWFLSRSTLNTVSFDNLVNNILYGGMFNGFTNLSTVKLPNNVSNIPLEAFKGCTNLQSINLYSVTSIGMDAFNGCVKLRYVTTSGSLLDIYERAFKGCEQLSTIALGNKLESINDNAFEGCIALVDITLPNSLVKIGVGAFMNCESLTSVTVGDETSNIGMNAFKGCKSITSATFGRGVYTIPQGCFSDCTKLESVTFLADLECIESYAFDQCTVLSEIVLAQGQAFEVRQYGFIGCGHDFEFKSKSTRHTLELYEDEGMTKPMTGHDLLGFEGTVYLKWNVIMVKVTMNPNGGMLPQDVPNYKEVEISTEIGQLPEPTRGGYTFLGWYTMPEGGVHVNSMWVASYNCTIYAQWELTKYRIIFDTGGGTYIDSINAVPGTPIQKPEPPTREGYTFIRWDIGIPDVMPAYDMTITAIWDANKYTLTLKDGDDIVVELSFKCDESIPDLQSYVTAEKGYVFGGWEPEAPATMPAHDLVLVVYWFPEEYEIVFDTCTPEVAPPGNILVLYGEPYRNLTNITRTGYDFLGWYTQEKGGELITNDTIVPFLSDITTLYAHWEKKYYKVFFDTDGGDEIEPLPVLYGEYVDVTKIPVKPGYDFRGWDPYSSFYMPANDVTLKAIWDAGVFKVDFDPCADIPFEPVVIEVTYGQKYPALPPVYVPPGQLFLGWFTEKKGGDLIAEGMEVKIVRQTTLYAHWETIKYTITFDTDGGDPIEDSEHEFGDKLYVPTPTKVGHTFLGWYIGNEKFEFPATMPAYDISVKARWKINVYTITFDTGGGPTTDSITAEYGTTITPPPDPVWEGHTFLGWYNGNVTYIIPDTMPAENLVIKARWEVHTYTITFDTGGGPTTDSITAEYGTTITPPPDPVWEGHTFLGWYIGNEKFEFPATMPAYNMTVVAKWEAHTFTVGFEPCREGVDTPPHITVTYGQRFGPLPVLSSDLVEFYGWYTEMEGGELITEDTIVTILGDITLYGQWGPHRYRITFDSDGGTPIDPIIAPSGVAITAPANPVKEGHTFICWMRDGVEYTIPDTMPEEDVILKAKWVINVHTITFYDGDEVYHSATYVFGAEIVLPADPVKTGYAFMGWDFLVPDLMPDMDLVLHAVWLADIYEVSFDPCSELPTPISMFVIYGETFGELPVLEKPRYRFMGWFTDPNGGDMITSDTIVTILEDIILYAHWEDVLYTISFDSAGGSPVDPIIGVFGMAIVAPKDPTRPGYMFMGWDTEIPLTMPDHDMLITATWEPMTYLIVFDNNGGMGTMRSQTIIFGVPTSLNANKFIMGGVAFIGWNTEKDGTGRFFADRATLTDLVPTDDGTITLYAQWRTVILTIVFDSNGGGGNMAPLSVFFDDQYVTIPDSGFIRDGHGFARWNTASDSSGTSYSPGDRIDVNDIAGDMTLYAIWEPDFDWFPVGIIAAMGAILTLLFVIRRF